MLTVVHSEGSWGPIGPVSEQSSTQTVYCIGYNATDFEEVQRTSGTLAMQDCMKVGCDYQCC